MMTNHPAPLCPVCGTGLNQPHKKDCTIARMQCSVCGGCRGHCDCAEHDHQKILWSEEASLFWNPPFDEQPTAGNLAVESRHLGPTIGPGFVIGSHSDINGPDAVLVEFLPTRAELQTLAYHYLDRMFEVLAWGAVGYSGSRESRDLSFSERRFNAIAEALNPNPIKEFQDYIEKKETEVEKFRVAFEAQMEAEEKERGAEPEIGTDSE